MSAYIIPAFFCAIIVYGLIKGVNVYQAFVDGALEGIRCAFHILPYLLAMLVAINVFANAGALSFFADALSPLSGLLGIPKEVVPLALIRPFSGSAALAMLKTMFDRYGVDSYASLTGAVMMGSTETVFYTVSLYYGSIGIRKTRHTIPAALLAGFAGMIASVILCRIMF
ncbi:MAG: spore maturation protein [Christensenellales bacterium]